MYLTVFFNVLIMLLYMSCGFLLVKAKKGFSDHAKSLSGILIYICCPCLLISSFQKMEYSVDNFLQACKFFVVSLILMALFIGVIFVIFKKKFENGKYRILAASSVLGNVGFFGLPILQSIFPNEPIVACYSMLNTISMNLIVFTLGVYLITKDKKYISIKNALLNPTTISAYIAIPLYFLQFHFPAIINDSISLVAKMSTPLCMIVLGMRLASMKFKDVFGNPLGYLACALKLIVFPLFAYLAVLNSPMFDQTFKISLLVLSSAPTAAVVLSQAEFHECEREFTADTVLLTSIACVITLPLLLLIVGA